MSNQITLLATSKCTKRQDEKKTDLSEKMSDKKKKRRYSFRRNENTKKQSLHTDFKSLKSPK